MRGVGLDSSYEDITQRNRHAQPNGAQTHQEITYKTHWRAHRLKKRRTFSIFRWSESSLRMVVARTVQPESRAYHEKSRRSSGRLATKSPSASIRATYCRSVNVVYRKCLSGSPSRRLEFRTIFDILGERANNPAPVTLSISGRLTHLGLQLLRLQLYFRKVEIRGSFRI
jgi:hypothetical protein